MSAFVAGNADLSVAATVFCGVFVQALPFLVLGVVVSGLIAAFVSADRLARWLPRRPAVAVAVAGVGGAALPGCECGSVPVARRLFGEGVSGAAALTFMLSAPAINPVVLVATAVAFPGQPAMVLARCVASLITAVTMGLLWLRWGRAEWVTRRLPTPHDTDASRWTVFTEAARHDFLQAASYLVLGAAAAAVLRVAVPPWVFEHLAGHLVARRGDHGPVRRRAGAVLGGRRVRRREPDDAAAAAAAGVPGRRPGRRRQAVGDAGRDVRPPVRDPVRARDVRGRHGRRDDRRSGGPRRCAMSRGTQNTLLLLVGLSAVVMVIKGTYLHYVKPSLLPWLIAAATF